VDIAIFTYYYALPKDDPDNANYSIDAFNMNTICSPFILSPWHRQEVWRYFLYQFNHAGITHLISNLIFQIIIGSLIEMVHGSWVTMGLYFGGVVGGAMMGLAFSPEKMTVGASGGDYALIFAYLANLILNWDSMISRKPWKWARLAFIVWFIAMDIWNFVANKTGDVSIGGHIGGAIVGLTLGLFIMENFFVSRCDNVFKYIGLACFIIFIIFNICWQIFNPKLRAQDELGPPCGYFSSCGNCTSN